MKRKTHPHPAKFSDQVLAAMSIMLDLCKRLDVLFAEIDEAEL